MKFRHIHWHIQNNCLWIWWNVAVHYGVYFYYFHRFISAFWDLKKFIFAATCLCIHFFNVHIKWPGFADFLNSIREFQAKSASIPSTLHRHFVHSLSHAFLNQTQHFKSLQKASISFLFDISSHTKSAFHLFILHSIHTGHSTHFFVNLFQVYQA